MWVFVVFFFSKDRQNTIAICVLEPEHMHIKWTLYEMNRKTFHIALMLIIMNN
jgi:hypothetical protein